MNICVLGWYGTETLGDRAILDGIIRIFDNIDRANSFSIASLYPCVTERTIFEDLPLYQKHSDLIRIDTFDVRDRKILKEKIRAADIVIMGGGPLMDLAEMYIIDRAFTIAKKLKKATALIGCGYDSLCSNEYKKCISKIVSKCDIVIMRSKRCMENISTICNESQRKKIYFSLDPAEISVIEYANAFDSVEVSDTWIMNVRDLDYVYGAKLLYERERELVSSVAKKVPKLTLMPMHTFSLGGDDRYIQNQIAFDINMENVFVIQKPLSLEEAYITVSNAIGCVGMRYHSIVFHTFLNGNNYIIDYTDINKGKISSFLKDLEGRDFFKLRYVNISESNNLILDDQNNHFEYNKSMAKDSLNTYRELILNLLGD